MKFGKYRYQLQTTLRAAELTGRVMFQQWAVHGDMLYKNVKSFKKAKHLFNLLPKGSRMVDKKKKLYWEKGKV